MASFRFMNPGRRLESGMLARRAQGQRRAFTLVEVLLALSLSAIILLMIAGTIRLHMRMLDTRRSGIDNAELARAVLRQIRVDLESATLVGEPTTTGAFDEAEDDALAAVAGAATGSEAESGTATSDVEAESDEADAEQQSTAGMYGTLYDIRFETSRTTRTMTQSLPTRPELAELDPGVPRSGVQTVGYFLGVPMVNSLTSVGTLGGNLTGGPAGGTTGTATQSSTGAATGSGPRFALMRLVMDHSVHMFMVENGGATGAQSYAREFAPEVTYLTFRYYDGIQWLEQWDSTLQGGLPVAVEVTIQLTSGDEFGRAGTGGAAPATNISSVARSGVGDGVYQMVVRLPVGQRTYDNEEAY